MLNATVTTLLLELTAHARSTGATELAERGDAALLASAKHRASVARAASKRTGKGKGGAPKRLYVVELEPGARWTAWGGEAAHGALVAAVRSVGAARRLPTPASLAVQVSRDGQWSTLLETDNGTVQATVRPATPAEAKEHELA